jgi:hypothetical protein
MIRANYRAATSVRGWRSVTAALLLGSCLAGPVLAEETTTAKPATTETTPAVPAAPAFDFKVDVSSIDVTDGDITGPELRELFGPDADLDKLATINAKRIYIPSITLVMTGPVENGQRVTFTTTFSDVEFNDVTDGVAATSSIGKVIVSGIPDFSFTYGKLDATNLSVVALLGAYGLISPETAGTEPNLIYGSFTAEGGAITSPVVNCTIGGFDAGNVYARALSVSIVDYYDAIDRITIATSASEQPAPEDVTTVVTFITDSVTAATGSSATFHGFQCSGTDPDTKSPFSVSSGDLAFSAYGSGVTPSMSLSDIKADLGPVGTFNLGNFTFKAMDLNGPVEALRSAETLDEAWFIDNWRKLIPVAEGLALTGLDMDVIDPEKPGERVKLKIAGFDATLGSYVNGIPSNISVSTDGLTAPVPANDPSMATLVQAGITNVDLSFGTSFHWDEANSTIIVDRLEFDSPELGRFGISGTLGNATADLFAEDTEAAAAASLGLTVKDLHITLEDKGIAPLIIAAGAKEAGQPEGTFKTLIAGQMQGMLLAVLGSTESSMTAATAIGDFIQGKKVLDLTLTAVDPAGVSLAEFSAASENPTVLAGKFTIAGEAK